MVNLNLEVFKEPKGFIKIIQILFIIITLSCICSFGGITEVNVISNNVSNIVSMNVNYPFKLTSQKNLLINLNNSNFLPSGDFESSSQFSVFVSAVSLVYCVAAIVIYLVFNDFIYRDPKIRKADFVIETVLTFLWFVIAIAWSDVVAKLKYISSGKQLCNQITHFNSTFTCKPISPDFPYGGAYIGIIASFTTFGLMLSGLWFLWKETSWFNKPVDNTYAPNNDIPQSNNTITTDRPYY